MENQDEVRLAVEIISMKVSDELTNDMVRLGSGSYSNCYPFENGYCDGVDRALEQLIEKLFEKYTITLKLK